MLLLNDLHPFGLALCMAGCTLVLAAAMGAILARVFPVAGLPLYFDRMLVALILINPVAPSLYVSIFLFIEDLLRNPASGQSIFRIAGRTMLGSFMITFPVSFAGFFRHSWRGLGRAVFQTYGCGSLPHSGSLSSLRRSRSFRPRLRHIGGLRKTAFIERGAQAKQKK